MSAQKPKTLIKLSFLFAFVAAFTFLALRFPTDSIAAPLDNFHPGNIISDYTMSNVDTMSVSDIQRFLSEKGNCNNTSTYQAAWYPSVSYHIENDHFVCLADERFGDGTRYGSDLAPGEGQTAAEIIYEVAHEYEINPQVLIVLLQKEQGLISDSWPNSLQYRSATGYGCPDTAACDSKYYGFKNQLKNAAALFRAVLDGGWTNYPLGENFIYYNPNRDCGGSVVNVENLATSALYRYTPYQPNAAALAAGYGTVSCGAYGNRNFYLYFVDYFNYDPTDTGGPAYEPFITPRFMTLKENVTRINPFTGEAFDTLEAGRTLRYTTKILLSDGWYYRSEVCSSAGIDAVVPASAVEEISIAYEPFITPRFMTLKENVTRINPFTGEAFDTLEAGRTLRYTTKILLSDGWYYRSEVCSSAGIDAVVPASAVEENTQ